MRKKFIVTGGAGFIGSHIVDELIKHKYKVVVLDNLSTGIRNNINKSAKFIKVDIAKSKKIDKFIKKADGVFHAAALPKIQPSFEDPITHHQSNIDATLNILLSMKKVGCKKIVYSSSSACYGNTREIPTSESSKIDLLNPYALQKYASEQYM